MFGFFGQHSYAVSETTKHSQYVLRGDGTFTLQFHPPGLNFFEYRGTYSQVDGALTFAFESGNLAGAWSASGFIDGDRLAVDPIMQHADFENAI